MTAFAIRDDIGSEELRRRARPESDGRVRARLIAIVNAVEGMDRASAARLAGMDRRTLRDWVHRYSASALRLYLGILAFWLAWALGEPELVQQQRISALGFLI
jgi:hypothetical protein